MLQLSSYAIEHYLALNPFLGLIKRQGRPIIEEAKISQGQGSGPCKVPNMNLIQNEAIPHPQPSLLVFLLYSLGQAIKKNPRHGIDSKWKEPKSL